MNLTTKVQRQRQRSPLVQAPFQDIVPSVDKNNLDWTKLCCTVNTEH